MTSRSFQSPLVIAAITFALFVLIVGSFLPTHAGSVKKLVVLGDSLSAGYQLPPRAGFPSRLQEALDLKGHGVTVIGAGVSGDTTSGGLARLDWSVPDGTDAVIVELGANDAMRGLPAQQVEQNLDSIIQRLKQRNIRVLLAGMLAPPNMGARYGGQFNGIYSKLADKHDIELYPFFLDGVAANPALNLADGIHPNEKGIDVIVERILPSVEKLID